MEFLDLAEGRLAVAPGIGLVIADERERRKGEGPSRRGAGIRTFAVVALLGGVVAMLHGEARTGLVLLLGTTWLAALV